MGNIQEQKLSHKLLDIGYFCALGTTECVRGKNQIVQPLARNHVDHNMNVFVVYDEEGRPWIVRGTDQRADELLALKDEYDLMWGAYVPHSNDGGNFVVKVLPKLTLSPHAELDEVVRQGNAAVFGDHRPVR